MHVSTLAKAFKKIKFYPRENVGIGEIHLPPEESETEACELVLQPELIAQLGLKKGGERRLARANASVSTRMMERLCAPVPKPRKHLVTYHGVLAPASGPRSRVVPRAVGDDGEGVAE